MSKCCDWPCCGHESGCCPDFDEDGATLIVGDKVVTILAGPHRPVINVETAIVITPKPES